MNEKIGNPSRGITKTASLNVNATALEVSVDLLLSYGNLFSQRISKVDLAHLRGSKSSSALDRNNLTADILDKNGSFCRKSTVSFLLQIGLAHTELECQS